MIVFIGWGIVAAGMAAMLGMRQLSDAQTQNVASSGLLTWLESTLDPYAFISLSSSSAASLLLALLLRKVVLIGLRER
jgi:hypothetical protein